MTNRAGIGPNDEKTIVALSNDGLRNVIELLADTVTNRLLVNSTISGTVTTADSIPTVLVAFTTTVSSAGSRVQLASNSIQAGVLQAPSTNTGVIYVGGSNVSSTVFGAELQPGQATGVAINDSNKLYIDASVSGDKVAFLGS